MRILYISNEYPPETGFGGIGTYTRTIAEEMAIRGHDVHVICRSAFNKSECYILGNVTIHRIPPASYPLPAGKVWYIFRKLCYKYIPHTLQRLSWAKAVSTHFSHLQQTIGIFDIIEYPECGAEGFYLQTTDTKTVRLHTPWHMVQSLDNLKEPFPDRFLLHLIEKVSVKKARIVTSPSQALADILSAKWHINDIKVIPNPISNKNYQTASGSGWIYTGRVEMRKGVHNLIKAYGALSQQKVLPQLTLIGKAYGNMPDGKSYESFIYNMIKQFNLERKITWLHGIPHEQVKIHLQNSSVAFFPSVWENFSYACLEAMACGLTVVASNVGGFPEMIEKDQSGILVSSETSDDLVAAMAFLLENPELSHSLGLNARKRVQEKFDSTIICKNMEKIYLDHSNSALKQNSEEKSTS